MRSISHTEIATLLDCPAAHDMAYVGQLAGTPLAARATPAVLRQSRAWSAGATAWHSSGDVMKARAAIVGSLGRDADRQKRYPCCYDGEAHVAMQGRLVALIAEYARTVPRLPIDRVDPIEVPIPSRSGLGRSNAYALRCFPLGIHVDRDGQAWVVDFRLHRALASGLVTTLSREVRWNAWGWRERTGIQPAGLIIDQRLDELPKPARILRSGYASHAKDQLTTPELYLQVCQETGTEPDAEALAAYRARTWHRRDPVPLRDGELDEVGAEISSLAQLIRQYDTGALRPVRNPSRVRCDRCRFKLACPNPRDTATVGRHYERRTPKRLYQPAGDRRTP